MALANPAPIRRQPRLGHAHKSVRPALTVAPVPPPQHGIAPAIKGYDAARQDRLTSDWTAVSRLSADAELQGKIPIIRDRVREFERNDPLAKNFLFLVENNVVGDKGFSFESKVVSSRSVDPATGEETTNYNAPACRAVERAWRQFGHRENFLTTRNMDMTSAWKLIARTLWGVGDCLLRKVRGYPNKFNFAVQLLEPDFLDDQYIEFRGVPCNCPQELTLPDGRPFPLCQRGLHQVRMGVELHGDWMFPLAYWILADHPGDYFFGNQYNTRRTRVRVDDMIHPFVFKRMGQTRGVTEMEAAMFRMQMLGGMNEAALVKARAAAQKIGLIEKDVPDSLADQFEDEYKQGVPTLDCEPGGMLELPVGFHFKAWDPQDPSPQYAEFVKHQIRMVGASTGVSYTSLSNDIENVNFSSIRSGLLEEREGWKGRQAFFIAEVIRPIFEAWVPMAILSGQLDAPMSLVDDIIDQEAACFRGRRWPWVDPEKDVAAAQAAVDGGFKTRSEVIAEMDTDGDFERTTAGLGREKKMRAAEGLLPPAEAVGDPQESAQDDNPGEPAVKTFTQAELLEAVKAFHREEEIEPILAALKRDGWVTINGAAVHLGDDGTVDKGPARLVQHFGRKEAGPDGAKPSGTLGKVGGRALSADDFTHSARATASGHALHFLPTSSLNRAWSKDSAHIPVGGGGPEIPGRQAGFTDFVGQGKPIEAGELHVDDQGVASFVNGRHRTAAMRDAGLTHVPVTMTGASRANAEKHGLFTAVKEAAPVPAKPARQKRSFTLPFAPTGAEDVLDHIADQGGMMSRTKAVKQGHPTVASDYDDAPELRGVYHQAVFGGTIKPDRMAHILHQDHGVGDGSIGGLYGAIGEAVRTRQTVQKETKRQEVEYQQGQRFEKEGLTPHKGDQPVHVGSLSVGDTVVVHGEHLKVKDIDPETMDVTLQDHSRYGAQRVSDNQVLYVEHVEHKDGDDPF